MGSLESAAKILSFLDMAEEEILPQFTCLSCSLLLGIDLRVELVRVLCSLGFHDHIFLSVACFGVKRIVERLRARSGRRELGRGLELGSLDPPLGGLQLGDQGEDGDDEDEDKQEEHDDGDHLPGEECLPEPGSTSLHPLLLGLQGDQLLGGAGAGHAGPGQAHRARGARADSTRALTSLL